MQLSRTTRQNFTLQSPNSCKKCLKLLCTGELVHKHSVRSIFCRVFVCCHPPPECLLYAARVSAVSAWPADAGVSAVRRRSVCCPPPPCLFNCHRNVCWPPPECLLSTARVSAARRRSVCSTATGMPAVRRRSVCCPPPECLLSVAGVSAKC